MAKYVPIKDYSANLVANYKFNETTGTTCIDSKGNYNGTYNETISITDTNGTFRRFNGASDYINFTNQVIPLGKKSIKFRFKNNASGQQIIIDTCGNQTSYSGIVIAIGSSGKINVTSTTGSGSRFSISSNKIVNDGVWHDFLFTWDGTVNANSAKIYIDDLSKYNNVTTSNSTEMSNAQFNLKIGRVSQDGSGSPSYYNGDLDDIEIYNDVVEFKRFIKYLAQSDTNICSINPSFYGGTIPSTLTSVGNVPVTENMFTTYGADDLSGFNGRQDIINNIPTESFDILMYKG